jgi:hypothetical protein
MKLTELASLKKVSEDTIAAFLNKLIKDGKIKVRNGSFAFVVIPTDADFVYKVWTEDDAWEHYLKYVQAHPDNEHLLKILGRVKTIPFTFKRPKDVDAKLKIVKIEKLGELQKDPEAYGQVKGLTKFLRSHKVDSLTHDDAADIAQYIVDAEGVASVPLDFIKTVIDVVQARGLNDNDLHTENVMLRGKTLVVTDPYMERSSNSGTIKLSASDLLHGKYYGQHDDKETKTGR